MCPIKAEQIKVWAKLVTQMRLHLKNASNIYIIKDTDGKNIITLDWQMNNFD